MPVKTYLSNVYAPASIAWQETILAPVVPGWPNDVQIFRDDLGRLDRRRAKPELLIDRGEMLRPTSRKESDTIYLASLTVLGWNENDFRNIVKIILERGGTIVALNENITIMPSISMALEWIVENWKLARKRQRIVNAQKKGGKVSADIKKTKSIEGIEKIRQYWGMPADEWPTLKLRQMAGTDDQPMSYNTIVAHIGYGREIARKKYLATLRRGTTMMLG